MRVWVIGLGGCWAGLAAAQQCPERAERGPSIASGTSFEVLAVHAEDSLVGEEPRWIGVTGTTTGMTSTGPCWFQGDVTRPDGTTSYFYKVAVDARGASGVWSDCPVGALYEPPPAGRRLTVLALHPEDSSGYSGLATGMMVTSSAEVVSNGGCWFGGLVRLDNGQDVYTYKVAYGSEEDVCPVAALTGPLPAGTAARIARVHPRDPNPPATLPVGEPVVARALKATGACWYSGVIEVDGQPITVQRIALGRAGGALARCPDGAANAPLGAGARARVVGVHPDDAYASVHEDLIGRDVILSGSTGVVGCWHRGDARTPEGTPMRFYRVALAPVTP
jgi:hypothetical protein